MATPNLKPVWFSCEPDSMADISLPYHWLNHNAVTPGSWEGSVSQCEQVLAWGKAAALTGPAVQTRGNCDLTQTVMQCAT